MPGSFRGETFQSQGLSSDSRGFTLVEILVVIGIFLLLAALTLGIGVDTARRATVGSERTLLVELLERARSRAMNNIGEKPHGVTVTPTDFVLFQGVPNPATDEVSPRGDGITVTGPTDPVTVVFAQLSGAVDVAQTGDIVVSNGDQTSTVGINTAGRIDW
ncbi:MAG: type II secretion system protein [bacterium]|nr:type II secretion system protein [bacterium]